jgi:hypothetical protein
MSANPSAYAILGLEPGADRASVEAAYKKLIKRYHPDRKGGSATRAAEINRAYSELRGRQEQEWHTDGPVDIAEAIYARRAHRFRKLKRPPRLWPPLLALALIGAGVDQRAHVKRFAARVEQGFQRMIEPPASYADGVQVERTAAFDESLNEDVIQTSIAAAGRMVRERDSEDLAEHSRDCHRQMRRSPSGATLDRCAAFDIAVVAILRRDPLQDEGPFSASAVTARQMAAARLLTDDYNSIELRLDQIRSRVEATLAPPQQ